MSKQTTKNKPPSDPVESAALAIKKICAKADESPAAIIGDYDSLAAMVQTVYVVRAIDRLTAAIKENTITVRRNGPNAD